jgi:hypothetical protein
VATPSRQTGSATISTIPGTLFGLVLAAGAGAAATATIREGTGDTDPVIQTLVALQGTTVPFAVPDRHGMPFQQLRVTLSGSGAEYTVYLA